ncbi:MAG: response regulator [Deltaproteobacteria bacterium]|nr:response regulator [Deltaproteobacteria bacterium]
MIEDVNILVIDDEAVIRDGCVKVLTKDGWKVDTASDGIAGLEMIKAKKYDILFLDLMMPGINGLEVIPRVKDIDPDVYIIVITGYATIETAVEAMKRGAFDYISKPFTPDQLRMGVRKALDNKSLRLEADYLRREQEKGLLAIAQEKSRIITILNCMPDGVIVVDETKRIALYNPIAGKLLKISGREVIGEQIASCIRCEDFCLAVDEVLESSPAKHVRIAKEIEDEGFPPLMVHIAPVQMEDGRVIGVVVILQDISDQKMLEKIKYDLLTKITHEIKAPAATISQLLMAALDGTAGNMKDEQRNFVTRAREWSEDILQLVTDLLNISKVESGLAVQKLAPLNINEIIGQALDLIKPQADKKKIEIITDLSNDLPLVNADSNGMREVFTNLLSNAIKYSDEKTRVSISSRTDGDYLKISVSDQGFGIKKEDITFLFDKFFRVKNDKTRYIIGTGLGLPIVKQIIEAHYGMIDVSSEVNKGSTFTVYLPKKINHPE